MGIGFKIAFLGTIVVWALRLQFRVALKFCFHQGGNRALGDINTLGLFPGQFSSESLLKQVKYSKRPKPEALWWRVPGRVVLEALIQVEVQLVALVFKVRSGGEEGKERPLMWEH